MKAISFSSLICIALLAGCASANQTDLTSHELPASVSITFNVLLPELSPAGEGVIFTVLDDVTGLELNPQRTSMESSGERSYAVTLSVPVGTLLKYRYERQSETIIPELNANGDPIAYRAYIVDGPGHVAHDLIAAWADAPAALSTGQANGTLTAAGSGRPISNALVIAAGMHTRSDETGNFVIADLPQGLHNLVAFTEDGSYLPFQQGALVAAGTETSASIQLQPNVLATVTFSLTPPQDHTPGVPVYIVGNVGDLVFRPLMSPQPDGSYMLTLQLPAGIDLRYKYTLGDAFWNAEHNADGSFVLRQVIVAAGTTEPLIQDQIAMWSSAGTAAIWFDLSAPPGDGAAFIQFNLGGWSPSLLMWPLGEGHWAYKLYSPTNFASPIEYRYCQDAACAFPEAGEDVRTATGNQQTIQIIEDRVEGWQGQ